MMNHCILLVYLDLPRSQIEHYSALLITNANQKNCFKDYNTKKYMRETAFNNNLRYSVGTTNSKILCITLFSTFFIAALVAMHFIEFHVHGSSNPLEITESGTYIQIKNIWSCC